VRASLELRLNLHVDVLSVQIVNDMMDLFAHHGPGAVAPGR
jgi:hypothetical protein